MSKVLIFFVILHPQKMVMENMKYGTMNDRMSVLASRILAITPPPYQCIDYQ